MRESWQKGIDGLPQKATEGKKVVSVDGTFDDFSATGIEKGKADAVIIAQAFHWCPDYETALVSPRTILTSTLQADFALARNCSIPETWPTARPTLEPRGPEIIPLIPRSTIV